jgi:integrase
MSIYKRSANYWYKFMWNGKVVRESTKQGNDKIARQMECAHKTSLAKGEVGLRDKKIVPTFAEFCRERFEPWARSNFERTCRNSWLWYRAGLRAILDNRTLGSRRLDEISGEEVAAFVAKRQAGGLQVSSINSSLRVLRRITRLAVEWGALDSAPKIELLSGERHREHVVTRDEEARYLLSASQLLSEVVTVLADTGLRPDECYRMRWEEITWGNGRNGTLLITYGKTAAARRVLPSHPKSQIRAGNALGDSWKAGRGLGMACAHTSWSHRSFKP